MFRKVKSMVVWRKFDVLLQSTGHVAIKVDLKRVTQKYLKCLENNGGKETLSWKFYAYMITISI